MSELNTQMSTYKSEVYDDTFLAVLFEEVEFEISLSHN